MKPLRIGTRGSALALYQAGLVQDMLRAALPEREVEIVVIQSLGDLVPDRPLDSLGQPGIFTHAIEAALHAGSVDLAVHSAKDLPSTLDDRFVLVASLAREDPHDCLVSRESLSLDRFTPGATIGTGSPRRAAQLRLLRPDLEYVPIRGNVDTRRRKAFDGQVDAVVLAAAGLRRLGLYDHTAVPLPYGICLPQAGQGIIAVEARAGDERVALALAAIDDPEASTCLAAERAVLAGLSAGCQAPVAAFARLDGDKLQVQGLVVGPHGAIRAEREGHIARAWQLGAAVAAALRQAGAEQELAGARADGG